jgi:GNAT superfamily N-acetyltransferase
VIAYRIGADDLALEQALALMREAFAYMDGIIDPPSSVHGLMLAALQATETEVWAIGRPVEACVVLRPKAPALHVGKLAVAALARRRRLGTILINSAEERAHALASLIWNSRHG